MHADALLVAEHTLNGLAGPTTIKNDARPQQMYGDIVRAAQIYNRTMLLIWDCFIVCGLQRFIVSHCIHLIGCAFGCVRRKTFN